LMLVFWGRRVGMGGVVLWVLRCEGLENWY
jgi:hypothetical protein